MSASGQNEYLPSLDDIALERRRLPLMQEAFMNWGLSQRKFESVQIKISFRLHELRPILTVLHKERASEADG